MGCKAHITLRQYVLYPDYSLPKCRAFESKNQERLTKQQQLKQLRADLQSKLSITTVIKYHVSFPTEEAHYATHPTCGAHLMAQRINPTVAQKISELVREGIQNPKKSKGPLITTSTQSCVLTILLTLMIELTIQQIVI